MEQTLEIFANYLTIEKSYSIHTCHAYLFDLKAFFSYCLKNKLDILQFSAQDFRDYFHYLTTNKKLEKKTCSRMLSTLKLFYTTIDRQYGNQNSTLRQKLAPLQILPARSSSNGSSQAKKILAKRNRAIMELLYSSGIRVYELVNACLDDLSADHQSLRIIDRKGNTAYIFLDENLRKILDEYLTARKDAKLKGETIFLNQKGQKLTTRGIRYILKESHHHINEENKVTPHKFRYSFASDLLAAGENIRAVKELLGIDTTSNVPVYNHVNHDRIREIYKKSHPHAKNES